MPLKATPKKTLQQGGTHGDPRLTNGQNTFVFNLATQTGLDINVLAAWCLAEESGSAAASRQAEGNHDWLNIGYTDAGQRGTGNSFWSDPVQAAQATALWMAGKLSVPGFGTASQGIQAILKTAGQPAQAQIQAIASSGWATNPNYGATIQSLYTGGLAQPAPGAGPIGDAIDILNPFSTRGISIGQDLGNDALGALGSASQAVVGSLFGITGDVAAKLGVLLATATADAASSLYSLVWKPWWHWNQRAVMYYSQSELMDQGKAHWTVLPWTAVLWGFGYWLLWTDPNAQGIAPQPVRNTRLARHVRSAQALPARHSLIHPKKVAEKTPKKPTPHVSRATIQQTGTMTTTRPTPVRVHTDGEQSDRRFKLAPEGLPAARIERSGTASPRSDRRRDEASEAAHRDTPHRKPDQGNRAGGRPLPASGRTPSGPTESGEGDHRPRPGRGGVSDTHRRGGGRS